MLAKRIADSPSSIWAAGKGRALLMAADYPFQRIVGVEFMPELRRAAQKNIAGYSSDRQRCRQIEAICMDARDFQFPSRAAGGVSVQPFLRTDVRTVLENLRRSVEQAPRPVYIAYRFTEFENLLAQSGLAGEDCENGAVGGV